MNCAKSVKMIVILGCIVVNLVGCGMNDTTASSMSTVVSSQDTSSSSCNSEEKNDLQDFSQTLVDSTSVFLDQDQYTVFEKAQKIDYALWGQSSNLKGLNFKIEDAPTFVPMTQNAPTYVKLNGHDYEMDPVHIFPINRDKENAVISRLFSMFSINLVQAKSSKNKGF